MRQHRYQLLCQRCRQPVRLFFDPDQHHSSLPAVPAAVVEKIKKDEFDLLLNQSVESSRNLSFTIRVIGDSSGHSKAEVS